MISNVLVRSAYRALFAAIVFVGACAPAAPSNPTLGPKPAAAPTDSQSKPTQTSPDAPKTSGQVGAAATPVAPAAPSVQRVVFSTDPPRVEGNELRNLNIPDVWPLR